MARGELILAIAMTEPGTGSDLAGIKTRAVRDGEHYLVNGAKTFITNGMNADLVIVAVKTGPTELHAGISLLVVERGMQGFERGRNLEKLGQHAQDTAELFFDDVRVPAANLLGEEGAGLPVPDLATSRRSGSRSRSARSPAARGGLDRDARVRARRTAFGQPIGSFQNSRSSSPSATPSSRSRRRFSTAASRPCVGGTLRPRRRRSPSLVLRRCRAA